MTSRNFRLTLSIFKAGQNYLRMRERNQANALLPMLQFDAAQNARLAEAEENNQDRIILNKVNRPKSRALNYFGNFRMNFT